MKIDKIAIHHSGGIGTNDFASSAHLTFESINQAHKERWNFPSKYIPNSYGGYNFIYDPKLRKIHQYRAVGEETAAQKGSNFDTISICTIGNYALKPFPAPVKPVDELKQETITDITNFLLDLISGRAFSRSGYVVAPNTELKLSPTRIYPHYFFQPTQCYGQFMSADFFRKRVMNEYYLDIQRQIMAIYAKIIDIKNKRKLGKLGSSSDRFCEGHL